MAREQTLPIRWHYIAYGSKPGQQSVATPTPRRAAEIFFAAFPNARICAVREWRMDNAGFLKRQYSCPGQRDPRTWEKISRRDALPDEIGRD